MESPCFICSLSYKVSGFLVVNTVMRRVVVMRL